MHIERVIIRNYRCLAKIDMRLRNGMNIIVGDNEAGKSTFLEAVHLALTGQLYGRPAAYELHQYLFHEQAVADYMSALKSSAPKALPEILIELYFDDDPALAEWQGDNNSLSVDKRGVSFAIKFNEAHKADYQRYVANPADVLGLPIEYYKTEWMGFHHDQIAPRTRPLRSTIVDASNIRNNSLSTRYISDIIQDLPAADRVDLSLSYRSMKSKFMDDPRVKAINTGLAGKKLAMTDKTLSLSLDSGSRTNWEASMMPHLNAIPMPLVGKGEQNSVKIRLAIGAAEKTHVLLVEEPENHLSHGNLGRMIAAIDAGAQGRQVLLTSHSSFVINKLGIASLLLFANQTFLPLEALTPATADYFKKLPGYDTLRLILSRRCILVEGPSDELVVQKAYLAKHGRMPQDDGVDVISVRSLAFKRFLEIAKALGTLTAVVTDNDGNPGKLPMKYQDYAGVASIKLCYSTDASLKTLEPHMVKVNGLAGLNAVLGTSLTTEDALTEAMIDDKTGWALKVFETDKPIIFPDYINDAVS
jgi:hypothetical protein